jgi:hypothetical protein
MNLDLGTLVRGSLPAILIGASVYCVVTGQRLKRETIKLREEMYNEEMTRLLEEEY